MKRISVNTAGKRFRNELLASLFASIALQLFCIGPLYSATVYLDTVPELFQGLEFSVDVYADNSADVYGAAFDLIYDNEYLEVVDSDPAKDGLQPKVIEGTVLNNNGDDTTFLRASLEDETPGILVVGISRAGNVAGVATSAGQVLLSVRFVAKKIGSSSIFFNKQGLRDSDNAAIVVESWDGSTINILDALPFLPGDIDNSRTIDLHDVILSLQILNKIIPDTVVYMESDVDGDGKIGTEEALYDLQVAAGLRSIE